MLAPNNAFPGPPSLATLAGRVGLASLTAFVAIGVVLRVGHDPVTVAVGGVLAVGAAVPLFLFPSRFLLAAAALAGAGVVMMANADAGDIAWFALAVLAAWCVLAAGVRPGVAFWVATLATFGAEWLWAAPDVGWAPWMAGVTVTVLATLLIRHEFVLVERLKAAQAELAEQSRAEERSRIAGELHDVLAHSLTVSLLHVTSARLAVEHDPADAARALAEAERLGRQCLAEVRAAVGLLPEGGGIAPPVPGLDQLPALVAEHRSTGAAVALSMDGKCLAAPATTASTAYRIVQEALTNAAKHARHAPVAVTLAGRDGRLDIRVDSGGRPGHGSGMGLLSMTQRAKAVGGTCDAGPGGHGWLVHASLPLDDGSGDGAVP
ncbi:MAG: sensor histidine kinase [Acidimicrobiales bacterium]